MADVDERGITFQMPVDRPIGADQAQQEPLNNLNNAPRMHEHYGMAAPGMITPGISADPKQKIDPWAGTEVQRNPVLHGSENAGLNLTGGAMKGAKGMSGDVGYAVNQVCGMISELIGTKPNQEQTASPSPSFAMQGPRAPQPGLL